MTPAAAGSGLAVIAFTSIAVVWLAAISGGAAPAQGTASAASVMPVFDVDPAWPVLPKDWVMGQVPSIAVDSRDHVWILHRPRTVSAELQGRAAPPVLEFAANGTFVRGWGGAGSGFDWPDSEHGIAVDHKGSVWVGGSSPTSQSPTKRSDDMLLKFSSAGAFLLQIGGRDASGGNGDVRSVNKAADADVYPATNELFVADGYGNRRVIVFDADTGAFKRMWGAFGNVPQDAPPTPARGAAAGRVGGGQSPRLETEGTGPEQFGGPVHSVKVSRDGLVYVADRSNRRIQVFTLEGRFVSQVFINRAGPATGSAAGIAFSPDPEQRFMYVADYGNSRVVVVDRKTLNVLYQFGGRSPERGKFQGPHHLAVDSKGNLYTAEVSPGNRAQRFVFKGLSASPPPNALTAAEMSVTN